MPELFGVPSIVVNWPLTFAAARADHEPVAVPARPSTHLHTSEKDALRALRPEGQLGKLRRRQSWRRLQLALPSLLRLPSHLVRQTAGPRTPVTVRARTPEILPTASLGRGAMRSIGVNLPLPIPMILPGQDRSQTTAVSRSTQ
jgi:hypothetical protein